MNFTCRKCEGNIGEAVGLEGNLYDEVETVWEFTYLDDRVSGGCEAAVTARTRCGWAKFRECCDLRAERGCFLELCRASNTMQK